MLAPHLVRLHPNSLMRGSASVIALRAMGNTVPVTDTTAAFYKAELATLPAVPPNPDSIFQDRIVLERDRVLGAGMRVL